MNLRLLQISDSALPISGYTHSWGLEAAIARRWVHDPQTLENWTRCWLTTSLGPLEGVIVAASCRSAHDRDVATVVQLNDVVQATMVPPSLREASRQMGEQLVELGSTWAWSAAGLAPFVAVTSEGWHHCVAFGLLGALADAEPSEVLTAYLHQSALGVIGAGVRGIPVGHTHGQQILAYLQDDVLALVESIQDLPVEMAGSGCPHYEVLCDEQTRLYSRMYRS